LVVSLIVNNEEHLLRALADTGVSISSIILEAYGSAIWPFIKTDDSNTTTWSTMGGKFTTNKTGFVTFSLPEFNLKKRICYFWAFHVDDRPESSSTYDMIMGWDLLGELGIIRNFNDHTVTWDTDTIPMKDRDTCTLSSVEVLIDIYMSANEPKMLRDEYSRAIKILDAEYKPASLDDVIKTFEKLHVDKQHQLKLLLQKYERQFDGTLGEFNMEHKNN
jgi:hypothetical protein